MNNVIKVGSRESKLAVVQSEIVMDLIKKYSPTSVVELVTMKTTGDKILDKTLDKVGGKGLFVKELDRALLSGEVDIVVHSLKDVPMETDSRLPIVAYTKCQNPCDVLVLPKGKNNIDFSLPIGSSSQRRLIQLKKIYKNATFKPIRGNVITRLEKLDSGEYSALVLAAAGLERLDLTNRISRVFTTDEIIPAAGQGVLAIQTRKNDKFDFLQYINDKEAEICAKAERTFVTALDGGCSAPIGAYAKIDGNKISINGLFADENTMLVKKIQGDITESESLALSLAQSIREELQ